MNDDDDDWALQSVRQPPKRPPPHPDMPCHLDASHYPTTRQLTTEMVKAAAGENHDSRGSRCDVLRPRYFFSVLFVNTLLMTVDVLDISLELSPPGPSPHLPSGSFNSFLVAGPCQQYSTLMTWNSYFHGHWSLVTSCACV